MSISEVGLVIINNCEVDSSSGDLGNVIRHARVSSSLLTTYLFPLQETSMKPVVLQIETLSL